MTSRRWTARRIIGGVGRRIPLRPVRVLFPFGLWRPLFRLWLETIRAQPDKRKALQELLTVYGDAYVHMDRGAVDYGTGEHPKHRLTRYHDFFVDRIQAHERVLDVGCGIGSVAHDVANRAGAVVVAVDSSISAIETARTRFAHPRVTYTQADVLESRLDEVFDVVILSNVLEHLGPRVEFLRTLRELTGARRLLVRVPAFDRDWTVPLRRELELSYFSDPEHHVEYLPGLLREELRQGGWEMGKPTLAWGEIWVEATVAS